MTIMQRLRAKQKADAEHAAKRRAARIAKKVARAAAKDDGLNDLPLSVALAVELNPAPAKPEPETVPAADDSVAGGLATYGHPRENMATSGHVCG